MRRNFAGALALTLVLILTGAAIAQGGAPVAGKIIVVDPSASTITIESDGVRTMIRTNTSTMYMSGGQHVQLSSLKPGDQVTVRTTGDGTNLMATNVDVTTSGTPGMAGGMKYRDTTATTAGTTTMHGDTGGTMGTTVTGRVTSVDTANNTITVQTSRGTVVYKTDTTSHFMNDGRDSTFEELKVGDRVRVRFSGTGDNRMASHVEVLTTGTTGSPDYVAEGGSLPRTASSVPLIGLVGVLLIGVSFAVRAARRYAF